MADKSIIYTELSRKTAFECPIFHIDMLQSRSPDGMDLPFTSIECGNFAIIIPIEGSLLDDPSVIMVEQWRHAAKAVSLEFPGGMLNFNEDPTVGAIRECKEETGCTPNKMTLLGELSPNPAIMSNRFFVYLAEELSALGDQHLDPDEYVSVKKMRLSEVNAMVGKPPLISGLIAASLFLLNRYRETKCR